MNPKNRIGPTVMPTRKTNNTSGYTQHATPKQVQSMVKYRTRRFVLIPCTTPLPFPKIGNPVTNFSKFTTHVFTVATANNWPRSPRSSPIIV